MQTRPRGAHSASSEAGTSARTAFTGKPSSLRGPAVQLFFFFLKVNGPISHQLFSRNPSKGLKGSTQLQPIHIWKLFSTGGAPQGRVSGERRERRGDGHTHPSALGGLGVQSSCQAGAGRLTRVCEAGVMCAVAPRRLVSPEFRTCRAHRGLHVGSQVFTDLTGTLSPIPRLPAHLEPRR